MSKKDTTLFDILSAGYSVKVKVFKRAYGTGIRIILKSRDKDSPMEYSSSINWCDDIPEAIKCFAKEKKIIK
jgi:hypothetical protein